MLLSLELMELLLNYGSNYIVLDYYFAFMIASHQFCINRYQLIDAHQIEDMFEGYL